jgi:chromosome partitioning protein
VLKTQLHDREAFRAIFSFGGTVSGLDGANVRNIEAAVKNAREFASEVVAMLRAKRAGEQAA